MTITLNGTGSIVGSDRAALGANSDITSLTASGLTVNATSITAASINGGQLAGLRNRIINGGCQVAQRGTTAITNNVVVAYGGADRIGAAIGFTTGSGTMSQAESNLFESGYTQQIVVTATGTGAVTFVHRIEALNSLPLNGKTVTLQVKVWQNSGGTLPISLQIKKANVTDNFTATTTIATSSGLTCATSTITKLTFSATLSATDASNGLEILVSYSSVSAPSGVFFYVGDIQLEVGSVATPFEHRPYGLELALCQRYCTMFTGIVLPSVASQTAFYFPMAMRANPTIGQVSFTSGTGAVIAMLNTHAAYQTTAHSGVTGFMAIANAEI